MEQKKYAVFTMDVEAFSDTECIKSAGIPVNSQLLDGFDEYIRILDSHGIKSTLFTLADLAPKMADKLRACQKSGHELALHGYHHTAPMAISPEQFREDILVAKQQMQAIFGEDVKGYRAPFFSMDRSRLDVLRELGFGYDSSCLGYSGAWKTVELDLNDFQHPRQEIFCHGDFCEFGIGKEKVFGKQFPVSGGGYVRLVPWVIMKGIVRRHIRKSDYYAFYLHPFELTKKPFPRLKGLKGYEQYYIRYGVRSYGKRIQWIIGQLKKQGYQFVTFRQLSQIMQQNHTGQQ